MNTPAKAARVNKSLQVIQRMHDGMTVVDACEAVGIPRSTFYDIVKKNPEAIVDFQDIIDANNREQLGMALLANAEMLRKLIEDGLSDKTKPKDRIWCKYFIHSQKLEWKAACNNRV
jgi:predicted transcriptional regulator